MTTTDTQLSQLIDRELHSSSGQKIGRITDIYVDEATDQPEWALVNTGLFGMHSSFVPLDGLASSGDALVVPFDKDKVKNAPRKEDDGHLSENDESELYRYYGVNQPSSSNTDTSDASTTGTVGHDTSGPNTDDAMTRSEEVVDIDKRTVETGRARLRKHLVTEQRTITVPVTREEVRIEREAITDANIGAATSGAELSEEEHEVVLHAEQVSVDTHVVPVERVRLETDKVTTNETHTVDVQKEEIDIDTDVDAKKRS